MIRQFVVLFLSLYLLAAGPLLFRFQSNTPLLQRQGHRTLSQNQIRVNLNHHLTKVKLKFFRAQKMLSRDLHRLYQTGLLIRSKTIFVAQRAEKIVNLFMIILKRVLFLVSIFKLLSSALILYADGRTKIHQISEISASLSFITGAISSSGKHVMANAKDVLKLVSLVLFAFSLFSGCYFFALALLYAQYHRRTIKIRLDALMEHVDE